MRSRSNDGHAGTRLKGMPLLLAVAVLAFQGCATIMRGSSQSVIVNTKPPGANCTFTRGSQTIATANPTPETVLVPKGRNDVVVSCSKAGYRDAKAPLLASFEGWTFGNVLFGGIVGVFVDAGSGAMHDYPQSIKVTLIPLEFNSVGARDAFFDDLRAEVQGQSAATLASISAKCQPQSACDKIVLEAKQANDAKITELEAQRQRAIVSN